MRSARLQYSVITAALIGVCLGPGLRAEHAGQGDVLSRLVAHFGKVVILPSTQRVVFYVPQNEVWGLSKDNRIVERGDVHAQPGPDWRLELYWRNGLLDVLDPSNANDLEFVDETPPIVRQLEQITGKRLARAVGSLQAGTQLLEGGVVLNGSGEAIGEWEVRTTGVGFYPPDGLRRDLDPAEIIAALSDAQPEVN